MASAEPVVVIEELTKVYGEFTALDRLSLTLHRGQILGFIGPNGAGKTTTIKILVGLSRPTSGRATICGADCTKDSRRIKHLVGYMPDLFGSYDNMRVSEYLDFFGAVFRIPRGKRRQRIDEVLETTNATYMRDRYVESLSHGMQQRIGIARTLLHDPEVLILDEPANGLDPEARVEMREIILRLARLGKTLIVTSHILPELSRICDQVAIITHGKLRAFGSLADIMQRVSQQRTVEVQLSTGDRLEEAAEQVKAFHQGDATVTLSPAEGVVRFRTEKREEELGQLLAQLVSSGIPVTQFRELQVDLEDAFLSVTRADSASEVTVPAS
jgi:ABC-2 type transport system ATP-binding protein